MRKASILLTALLPVAVSCINSIELHVDDLEPVPVVNAHFRTDETEHFIFLSTSHLNSTDPFDEASVSISVNGGPSIVAEEIPKEEYHEYSVYRFEAVFNAGDEVTVSVYRNPFAATATAVFPKATDSLDVARSLHSFARPYGQEQMHRFDIRFDDIRGEDSFYRLDLDLEAESTNYYEGEGAAEPLIQHSVLTERYIFDTSSDPVINEGRSVEDGLLSEILPENVFCAFSDHSFKDSSCEVRAWMSTQIFTSLDFDLTADLVQIKPVVVVKIFTMDKDYFRYIKSLDNFEAFGYEMGLLTEPITLPTNVTGGLGFISAETCTSLSVPLPEITVHPGLYAH